MRPCLKKTQIICFHTGDHTSEEHVHYKKKKPHHQTKGIFSPFYVWVCRCFGGFLTKETMFEKTLIICFHTGDHTSEEHVHYNKKKPHHQTKGITFICLWK